MDLGGKKQANALLFLKVLFVYTQILSDTKLLFTDTLVLTADATV